MRRICPELRQQKNWLSHHNNTQFHTSVSHKGIFDQKQHECHSPLVLLFSASLNEDRTERPPCWHNRGIEAKSQAALKTLREHDFQEAFTKWQKRWERCIRAEGDCFEGEGGQ
jgi:hypothetical protein